MRISNPTARLGEEKASNFLKSKGYKIIDRNFRIGYGEIDIIAVKDNVLVFVEVKTRTSNTFGKPIEAITPWKLRPLLRTVEFYKKIRRNLPDQMRIDAISVEMSREGKVDTIVHTENISGF